MYECSSRYLHFVSSAKPEFASGSLLVN